MKTVKLITIILLLSTSLGCVRSPPVLKNEGLLLKIKEQSHFGAQLNCEFVDRDKIKTMNDIAFELIDTKSCAVKRRIVFSTISNEIDATLKHDMR